MQSSSEKGDSQENQLIIKGSLRVHPSFWRVEENLCNVTF